MTELSRTFGDEIVTPEERERRIRLVFQAVAPRYDLMNDLMSMGIHRLWKRAMARAAAVRPGDSVLDLAGGTGDVARLLAARGAQVTVCDPSDAMMAVGRARCPDGVRFLKGAAESIPAVSGCYDLVTIAFGLRNVTDMEVALAEMCRVLKPGGRLLCLEFSRPWALIRPFYQAYSATVIPRLGAWVADEPLAYDYLIESIRRFPDQAELAGHMRRAGFTGIGWRNYSFGIACLHSGTRPG